MTVRILQGDARDVLATMPDASVHCVVTSPPYYGLRDYGTAQWDGGDAGCDHTGVRRNHSDEKQATSAGTSRDPVSRECRLCGARRIDRQMGLEASPSEYIQGMVEVFREVRRVMRPDGTLWLNIGDSYAGGGTTGRNDADRNFTGGGGNKLGSGNPGNGANISRGGKPKDLLMMPARLALALQADGWWIRSDIIWAKPNPMPESVTDRPTSAHEHVFLLTKAARYYYDQCAIREPYNEASLGRYETPIKSTALGGLQPGGSGKRSGENSMIAPNPAGRSCRNVWSIATEAFPEAHFATFPTELASRCIKAGTSERGCCAACGAPWVREGDKELVDVWHRNKQPTRAALDVVAQEGGDQASRRARDGHVSGHAIKFTTTGWRAGCNHGGDPVPCTVLDCFAGAGTTLLVADRLQRNAIGIELNPAYAAMARNRITQDAGLFAEVAD